ncbi:hypothetical protein STRIP9103_00996 [Streptomyces ipomoeae 91-03]|uniref:Uncharacterized protein n=1 Tax=Streptomyces ipomoeae 91-03 TaxID=698759 RepID=L1L420_9ACTN|nr:hypothetical protein STRIP9103_00996 [Streptomyces ipomoeae 91-03]
MLGDLDRGERAAVRAGGKSVDLRRLVLEDQDRPPHVRVPLREVEDLLLGDAQRRQGYGQFEVGQPGAAAITTVSAMSSRLSSMRTSALSRTSTPVTRTPISASASCSTARRTHAATAWSAWTSSARSGASAAGSVVMGPLWSRWSLY